MEYNFNDELCREVHERYSSARFAGLEEAMRMIYEDAQLKKILERGDLAHFGTLGVFVTSEKRGDRLSFTRFDGAFAISQKQPKRSIKGADGNFTEIITAIRNRRQVLDKLRNAVLDYIVKVDRLNR